MRATLHRCRTPTDWLCPCGRVARELAAHGMVILELDDRFPPGADLDAAWARGLSAFAT